MIVAETKKSNVPPINGESFGKRRLGARLTYWPRHTSKKKSGIPLIRSMMVYGMRNAAVGTTSISKYMVMYMNPSSWGLDMAERFKISIVIDCYY